MSAPLPPKPSGHPVLGHAIPFVRGPFEFVEAAVAECGDAYRMELPVVDDVYALTHPEHFRRVLVADVDSFEKTEDFRRAFGNGLISVEGEQWRRQREIMRPLFFRERIGEYTDGMVACTRRRLDTWADGEVRDAEAEMRDLTLEVLFATLFGRDLHPGEDRTLRDAADGLNGWFAPTSWILPPWVPTPARRGFERSAARLREEVRTLLAEGGGRAGGASTAGPPDLLSRLRAARDAEDGPRLSAAEIEDQLVTMVFAGHETTAAALAFAWYLLATHPQVRRRFHEELDAVLGGGPPTTEDLADLEFTDRIVTETLRLYPPVHTIPRRATVETEFDGFRVPAGAQVHLSVIHAHRDRRWYDHPYEFRPDRWTDEFEADLHEFAYVPFGAGRRACIGREFARVEAKVVLATIGQRFRLEWEDDEGVDIAPRITIRSTDGIPMRIERR